MTGPKECRRFSEAQFSATAECLLLDEPVPAELQPLWEHTQRCLDCLAKLEEHRMWGERLQRSLKRRDDDASVVLRLSLLAIAWKVQVVRRSGWIGKERGIFVRAATRKGGVTTSVVEFDGFAVEVVPHEESVQVTVYSSEYEVSRLVVEALDDAGQCIERGVTDKHGSAILSIPSLSSYELKIVWPRSAA